jgi:hypothetical protein
MDVASYESEFVRPGLLIPLFPMPGVPGFIRRYVVGLRGPAFARARLATIAWAAVECVLAILSLALAPPWRRVLVIASALLGLYVIFRAVALAVFQQRQQAFEQAWIAARTDVLQQHAFEVVRFTVDDPPGIPETRRAYDLTRSADVRELLGRQDEERAAGRLSRATAEFGYRADGGVFAIAEVTRDLTDITFLPGRVRPGRASIRLPGARYRRSLGGGAAPQVRWTLAGPVVLTVSAWAYADAAGPAEASGLGSAR